MIYVKFLQPVYPYAYEKGVIAKVDPNKVQWAIDAGKLVVVKQDVIAPVEKEYVKRGRPRKND